MTISKRQFLGLAVAMMVAPVIASAQGLPDLNGRKVVVVTENAYPPLQFVDPKTGKRSAGNMTR
jgi:polar amino acid transport system substrate-binding protein